MQPWRRKKGLMRSPRFSTVFDPMEREVIGDLTATVSEALIQRAQSAPKDLSLIHISEPTRREWLSRMPSSA